MYNFKSKSLLEFRNLRVLFFNNYITLNSIYSKLFSCMIGLRLVVIKYKMSELTK